MPDRYAGRFASPAQRGRFGSHLRYIPPLGGNLGFPRGLGSPAGNASITVKLPPSITSNTKALYLQWTVDIIAPGPPQLFGSTDIYNAADLAAGGTLWRYLWNESANATPFYQHFTNGVGHTDFSTGIALLQGDIAVLQWNAGTLTFSAYRGGALIGGTTFSYNLGAVHFDTVVMNGVAERIIAQDSIPAVIPL